MLGFARAAYLAPRGPAEREYYWEMMNLTKSAHAEFHEIEDTYQWEIDHKPASPQLSQKTNQINWQIFWLVWMRPPTIFLFAIFLFPGH